MGFDLINTIKKKKGWTNDDLAKISGVPKATIDKITAGKTVNPNFDTVWALADALGCSVDDFHTKGGQKRTTFTEPEIELIQKYRTLEEYGKIMVDSVLNLAYDYQMATSTKGDSNNVTTLYPMNNFLIGASAGTGNFLDSDDYETIQLTEKPPRGADFIIDVCGDSMEPTYEDGDKVYVHRQEELDPGEIGIFYYDGDAYIKEYQPGRLVSHNKAYDDVLLSEFCNVRCYGKAIGVVDPDSIYG